MGKHSDFYLSFFHIMGFGQDFTAVTKRIKFFKNVYIVYIVYIRLYGF